MDASWARKVLTFLQQFWAGAPRIGVALARALIPFILISGARAEDADVARVLKRMSHEIDDVRSSCQGPVVVTPEKVRFSTKVSGVHVVLTSSGTCLGWFGRYDYLLVRDLGGQWQFVVNGNPGPVNVSDTNGPHASIEIEALIGCHLRYVWTGLAYQKHASRECGEGRRLEGLVALEGVMRAAEASPRPDATPVQVLSDIISKVDRKQMVNWSSPDFARFAAPYLTPDLIATVTRGAIIANQQQIDLYDAELFTGRQSVNRARLLDAKVVRSSADETVVDAVVGVSESADPPSRGLKATYVLKRSDGSWKLDDFRTDPQLRLVKDIFRHPEKSDPCVRVCNRFQTYSKL